MKLKEVDPFAYYSQYQQQPIIPGGSLIKAEWWEYYDESGYELKRRCPVRIITADTAFGEKDANDFRRPSGLHDDGCTDLGSAGKEQDMTTPGIIIALFLVFIVGFVVGAWVGAAVGRVRGMFDDN